jgi:nitrogen regulatory protein PII
MYYLVVMVVNDPEDCPAVLDAWEAAGATGVTILYSSGLGHLRRAALLDNIPLMPSLESLFKDEEIHHRTLMCVVEGQEMVDRLVDAAHTVAGDLDKPHSGFLFVVPVAQVYGLGRAGDRNE